MTNRSKLNAKIEANEFKITQLRKLNVLLQRETLLLCDKKQQFEEKMETHGRGKNKEELLVGRIYWTQIFKDESTDEDFPIERTQIVRINGVWQN